MPGALRGIRADWAAADSEARKTTWRERGLLKAANAKLGLSSHAAKPTGQVEKLFSLSKKEQRTKQPKERWLHVMNRFILN